MTFFSRSTFTVAAACSAGALFAAAAQAEGPAVGQPAPGFTAVDATGVEHSLSDFADQTVVLEWTNHDCPYVVKHYNSGNMQGLQADAIEDGVVWLQVISSAPNRQGHLSGPDAIAKNEERNAAPSAVLIDESGAVGRLYDARTTPHMYVIHEGTLVYKGGIDDRPSAASSSLDGATNYVSAALTALQTGEEIAVTESQPYGCSVKYDTSGA
ncbi:MAG: redoxin domain-containing protein [Caulobacterales bacterium]|nr:redoxin domain-containing protein [Caulobacterales bacterium]